MNINFDDRFNEINDEILTHLWYEFRNIKKISQLIGKDIVRSRTLSKMIQPIVLNDIVRLAKNKNLTYPEIAKEIGIGLRALRHWMKIHNLEERFNLPARPSIKPTNKNYTNFDIVKTFLSLIGINEMKKIFGSSGKTITNKLIKNGLITSNKIINRRKVINHVKRKGFNGNFSTLLIEVIYGCLLGDGCICNTSTITNCPYSVDQYKNAILLLLKVCNSSEKAINSNLKENINIYNESARIVSSFPLGTFKYTANVKEYNWINYLTKLFENCGIRVYGGLKLGRESQIYNRTIKAGNAFWIESIASIELGKIEVEWYRVGTDNKRFKIVPRSLQSITPNILLAWFVGDGSNNKGSIELSSMNFSKEDNLYLVELLKKAGIPSRIDEKFDKRVNKNYIRIVIGRMHYQQFMNFINLAEPELLMIVKNTFPWKFDRNLSFKEWKSSLMKQSLL